MIRKYMFLPLIVAVLSIAFFTVSFFVFVSRGNRSLIKLKLAIGALIMTFTTFSTAAVATAKPTCYERMPEDYISIKNAGFDGVNLSINALEDNKLRCTIEGPTYDTYSYRIIGEKGEENQKGNITSADGLFDGYEESFEIEIAKDITPGNYVLYIYGVAVENQTENLDDYLGKYMLKISN